MKRFILCSLSAAMALAAGATAQAQTDISSAATHSDEGVMSRFELRQNRLTMGVLSPDDLGPNNRAVNMTGVPEFDTYNANNIYGSRANRMESLNAPPTGGVLSPDSEGPNNRAVPGPGYISPEDAPMQQTTTPNRNMQNRNSNVPGVVAPNSQGPNNRATPSQGTNQRQPMMQSPDAPPTGGILSPDAEGPNNRAVPGPGYVRPEDAPNQPMMNMGTQNQDSNVPGVVAPNSQSPNNRATPGQ
ncbi:hypothetical protein ACQ4N7_09475 [Nodosilinea sp. AN01ver1]|uniref:hypothetical protein n=1 Tax=Nodosilinea sp. AN01ver1 TaxID=3423362 RepID=UPI003D30EFD7